ncbi:helix-turn-helix domain-containing protein [Halegenticoccus tardaugens]|uniref:helix-turn-helix domain-containing protein n=1 Tax=Halegenticoccus tardaugens TaxID=2071624 RepID=UPI00100A8431|nr:helix-turn-helix domain-containing protein [Halegenticoccus tardaugens]
MPKVRMKVEASGSLAELSKAYPDATFRILTSISTDAGHMTLVEIESLEPGTVTDILEDDSDVLTYEVLHTDDHKAVIQFLQDSEPGAGIAARESGNPPPFPLVLRDGWIHAESTTTHDRLSAFKDQLDAVGVKYELLSITQSHDPTELLTERQREFVSKALEHGYYDSPRGSSLTDLADALNVNKATASGILHRAEGAIIKEFMEEASMEEDSTSR